MRKNLQKINGTRATFTGVFERFGTKNGWNGPEKTVLLKDIRNSSGEIVADHLWFNYTKGFQMLPLSPGVEVKFVARVKLYEKGYKGYREDVYKPIEYDYKLSHPTKICLVDQKLAEEYAVENLRSRNLVPQEDVRGGC